MVNLYCLLNDPLLTCYKCCSDSLLTVLLGICYCVHFFQHAPESSSSHSPLSPHQTTNQEGAEQAWRASHKKPGLSRYTNRAGSVKDLISQFSGPDHVSSSGSPQSPSSGSGQVPKSAPADALESPKSASSPSAMGGVGDDGAVPSITVTPPFRETQNVVQSAQKGSHTSKITAGIDCPVGGSAEKTDSEARSKTQTTESGRYSVADSGMGSVSKVPIDHFDDLA